MRKLVFVLLLVVAVVGVLVASGCTEADRVSHNVSMEADNFNVTRRLAVINVRTDKPMFEMIGNFSINTDKVDDQLEVTVETGPGQYKKHFVRLNQWTSYVVEDLSGARVEKYHYEVNYLPEMFVPVKFVTKP